MMQDIVISAVGGLLGFVGGILFAMGVIWVIESVYDKRKKNNE